MAEADYTPVSIFISRISFDYHLRTATMQKLCNLMQNDAINYEHCVREYYQPIVEDFGFIGLSPQH